MQEPESCQANSSEAGQLDVARAVRMLSTSHRRSDDLKLPIFTPIPACILAPSSARSGVFHDFIALPSPRLVLWCAFAHGFAAAGSRSIHRRLLKHISTETRSLSDMHNFA